MKSPTKMLRDSVSIFIKHKTVLVFVTLIPIIIGAFAEGAMQFIGFISNIAYGYNSNMVIAVVLALISVCAIVIIQAINIIFSILARIAIPRTVVDIKKKSKEEPVEIYRESLKYILPFILVSVLAGTIILPAAVLFVIPSLVLGVYLSFSIYSFVALNKRGIDALAYSFHLVRGRFWQVTGRLSVPFVGFLVVSSVPITLVWIGLMQQADGLWFMLIGSIAFIVIFILATPVFAIYKYQLFNALIDEAPNYVASESKRNRKLVKQLVVVGVILSALIVIATIVCAIVFGIKFVENKDSRFQHYSTDFKEFQTLDSVLLQYQNSILPGNVENIGFANYGSEVRHQSNDTSRFSGIGISFELPKGWYSFETNDQSDTQIVLRKGKLGAMSGQKDLYAGGIYVTTRGLSDSDEGMSGYQILLEQQARSAGTLGTLSGIVSHTVGSAQRGTDTAGILDLDISSNIGGRESGIKSKSVVTVEGGNVYTIVAIDDVWDYPALEMALEQIIKTLEFPEVEF